MFATVIGHICFNDDVQIFFFLFDTTQSLTFLIYIHAETSVHELHVPSK